MVKLFQGILGKVLGEIIGGFILMQSGLFTGVVGYFEIFRAKFSSFLYYIIFYIFIFYFINLKKYAPFAPCPVFTDVSRNLTFPLPAPFSPLLAPF